jgi:hypothetical protein
MVDLNVDHVPRQLTRRLASDARRRNVSINEAVVGVLAEHYRVTRDPTGAPFRGAPKGTTLLITLPDDLHRAVKMDAAATPRGTMRGLVISVLCRHYGINPPSPLRRPRTPTARRK